MGDKDFGELVRESSNLLSPLEMQTEIADLAESIAIEARKWRMNARAIENDAKSILDLIKKFK